MKVRVLGSGALWRVRGRSCAIVVRVLESSSLGSLISWCTGTLIVVFFCASVCYDGSMKRDLRSQANQKYLTQISNLGALRYSQRLASIYIHVHAVGIQV